jgi:hypothetical protein
MQSSALDKVFQAGVLGSQAGLNIERQARVVAVQQFCTAEALAQQVHNSLSTLMSISTSLDLL